MFSNRTIRTVGQKNPATLQMKVTGHSVVYHHPLCYASIDIQWCKVIKRKTQESDFQLLAFYFCDPPGARTQDPNIKSVVLYLLS